MLSAMAWEIDWDNVWKAAALLGTTSVGGLISNWFTQRRLRKDKIEELRLQQENKLEDQRSQRDDAYRVDLRHAQAQFIAGYSKFLTVAGQLAAITGALHEQRASAADYASKNGAGAQDAERAYSGAGAAELFEKGRAAVDALTAATVDADARLAEALLLEDRQSTQAQLLSIFENPLQMLAGPDDMARFVADVDRRRKLLDDFIRAQVGMFAEARWQQRKATVAGPPTSSPAP